MYTIEVHILCPVAHSEVLSTDMNAVELHIENIVSVALLELFETVYVSNVMVKLIGKEQEGNVPI